MNKRQKNKKFKQKLLSTVTRSSKVNTNKYFKPYKGLLGISNIPMTPYTPETMEELNEICKEFKPLDKESYKIKIFNPLVEVNSLANDFEKAGIFDLPPIPTPEKPVLNEEFLERFVLDLRHNPSNLIKNKRSKLSELFKQFKDNIISENRLFYEIVQIFESIQSETWSDGYREHIKKLDDFVEDHFPENDNKELLKDRKFAKFLFEQFRSYALDNF